MNSGCRASRHNQASVRGARESRHGALNLSGVAHVDRAHLHPKRWRYGLDRAKLADPGRLPGISNDCGAGYVWRDLLEQLQPFSAQTVFHTIKPVVFPPGRARLSTKPLPTGSMTVTNTIGTVRVASCKAASAGLL